MTMRKSNLIAVGGLVVLGGVALIGCSGDKGGLHSVNEQQAHDMNAARAKFEQSEDPPLKAETHFAAGQLNETQGAIALAIDQYEAALKLDPKCRPALFRLGCLYSQIKQHQQAIDTWYRYIEVTDDSASGYSNLAFAQELSGDRKAAEESYQAGIDRDPSNQACRVNYGLLLSRQGRFDEAKEQFCAVLSEAEAHYNIGSVLQQQGKKDAARAEFKA